MSLAQSQRFRWWPHGATKKGVFFDFDQTITTACKLPRFQRHAVADRPDIFANMTTEEVVSNFGGHQRIARLASLFSTLEDAGAELFIVSIGLRDSCILPHLRAVGLADFFNADNVFGQDSEALRSRALCKGRLVAALMAERGWEPDEALFIDDSARHIEATAGVCEVLKVAGRGLSDAELEAISVISQDSNVAKYGSKSPLPNGSHWKLQVDEAVPAAKVAIRAWCVEVSNERSRPLPSASPLTIPRMMRSTPKQSPNSSPSSGFRRALESSQVAAGCRRPAETGISYAKKEPLPPEASLTSSRRSVELSPTLQPRRLMVDSSPLTTKRSPETRNLCRSRCTAEASSVASNLFEAGRLNVSPAASRRLPLASRHSSLSTTAARRRRRGTMHTTTCAEVTSPRVPCK